MTDFDPSKLKHKPSGKHTLEEVLKSLQDLIHNDILRGPATPEAGAAPTPTSEMPPAPGFTTAPADMPLGSVVESLEELVAKDLADDDLMSKEAPATAAPKKPDSTQQAFGFDSMDGGGRATPGRSGLLPSRDTSTSLYVGAVAGTAADDSRDGGGRAASGTAAEDDWDAPLAESSEIDAAPLPMEDAADAADTTDFDIPVLTEPVPAERFTDDDIPVLENVAAPGEMSTAHEIAERVVARLNAERQARGEPALDAGVLEALRMLLREELERHPPA